MIKRNSLVMKKIFVISFFLFFFSFNHAQDTLLISQETILAKRYRNDGVDELFTILKNDTISLSKYNDSTYLFIYDISDLIGTQCIPFWIKNKKGYFFIYIYTDYILNFKKLILNFYYRKYRIRKLYGYIIGTTGPYFTNGTKRNNKLEYPPLIKTQLENCFCVP